MDARLTLMGKYYEVDPATGRTKVEDEFENMRRGRLESMSLLDPEYDESIDEEREHVYVYFGDDAGYVKLWELSYFLKL